MKNYLFTIVLTETKTFIRIFKSIGKIVFISIPHSNNAKVLLVLINKRAWYRWGLLRIKYLYDNSGIIWTLLIIISYKAGVSYNYLAFLSHLKKYF